MEGGEWRGGEREGRGEGGEGRGGEGVEERGVEWKRGGGEGKGGEGRGGKYLEIDIRWSFVESDSHCLQFLLQQIPLDFPFTSIQHHEHHIRCAGHCNDLSTPPLSWRSARLKREEGRRGERVKGCKEGGKTKEEDLPI